MKPSPLLLILVIPAITTLILQSPLRADVVETAVKDIRAKYNQIEGAKLTSNQIVWDSDQDPAWGTLTRYYKDGNLVKIHFNFGEGDHGGSDEYYYYSNGELFFAFVNQGYWRFTGRKMANGEEQTEDVEIEQRLYFSNGQLIRHLYKEASSSNPDLLKQIMAATENSFQEDREFASAVQRRGNLAAQAQNGSQVEHMIFGE